MRFFAYHIPQSNNKTHEENLLQLKRLGFHTNDYWTAEALELQQVLFVSFIVALGNVVGKEAHRARLAFGDTLELERTRNCVARVLENLLAF